MLHKTFCSLLIVAISCSCLPLNAQDLTWSDDDKWIVYTLNEGRDKTYQLIDVESQQKVPAFDHRRVALAYKEVSKKERISARRLPFRKIVPKSTNEFDLYDGENVWTLKTDNYELVKKAGDEGDSKLFLPPRRSRQSSRTTEVEFTNQLEAAVQIFWVDTSGNKVSYGAVQAGKTFSISSYVGHVWQFEVNGKVIGCYDTEPEGRLFLSNAAIERVNSKPRQASRPKTRKNEPRKWQAYVRQHDLWIKPAGEESGGVQLAEGTARNSFLRNHREVGTNPGGIGFADVRWSPNSKFLLTVQRQPIKTRRVSFVESSPSDQLQPKLQTFNYPKPGDKLVGKTYRLFSTDDHKEIEISNELFPNPYSLRFVDWSETGDRFYLYYNQRGHQVVRLMEITTATGAVRTIAENTSSTFVHYSNGGKAFYQFVGVDELIWASEKSGWNHLYRIDVDSGQQKNAITTGDWNVKRVVEVDQDNQLVWFYAVGIVADQDPYHEHFCRVKFDGTDFQVLTEGDGTHRIEFQRDKKYILDTWSRVDLAPVKELRDAETGQRIVELQRGDASQAFKERKLTERFSAAGRDGKTKIWGIIHFPKDFDPDKKYPVIENIYAGPHDHHVPKRFRKNFGHQHEIADEGMIVVQIDGMGTAWRSKAFHDVCYKNLRDGGFPDRIAWMKAAAQKYPQMDLSRVGIYGGSAGGQNAMAALLWHNEFYKVAVADCGCHDNRMDKMWWNEQWMGYPIDESYAENSNMENAHLLQGHLMLTLGEKDTNVDPASTTQVVNALIKADKDFEFVLVPGGGHGIGESRWARKKRINFFKTHLDVE